MRHLLLLSATLTVGDTATHEQPPRPPAQEVWVSAWKPVPGGLKFVTPMIWVDGDFRPGLDSESVDPEPLARASQSVPSGRRVLLWYRYFRSFWGARQDAIPLAGRLFDGPWSQFAIDKVQSEWSRFLQLYKYCGGSADFVVGDCEEWGRFTSWGLAPGQLGAIRTDARFTQAMHRCPSLSDLTAGVNLDEIGNPQRSTAYLEWNRAIGRLTAAVMARAIWDPAIAAFPSIKGCNYDGKRMIDRPAPDLNGHAQPSDNVFGTSPSPVAYGAIQQATTAWFIDQSDPSRLSHVGAHRIGRGPWQSFLVDVQLGRACRRGSPDAPMMPWVALRTYAGDTPGFVGYPDDPEYWSEMIRHYVLLGTSVFLWWNTTSLPGTDGSSLPAAGRDEMAREFDALMEEVNARTGGVVRKSITSEPISFESGVVASGAELADGRRMWRVTAKPGVRELRDTLSGQVVPLPDGARGFWVERRDDVFPRFEPVVTGQN